MRSTSGDSACARRSRRGPVRARRLVASPSSSILDDALRAARTRAGARIIGGGRLHRCESAQSGRRTNVFARTTPSRSTILATNRTNTTIAVTATTAANARSSATTATGEDGDMRRATIGRVRGRKTTTRARRTDDEARASRNTRLGGVFRKSRFAESNWTRHQLLLVYSVIDYS